MPTVQSKLSTQLTDVLGPPWHKWALITAGVVGTVFIGRYVAQKYYVESISKVLKDENDRHELIRKEKTGMEPPDTRSGTDGGPETGAEIGSKPSRSEPATPLNQPSGLAMLSDINRPALRGSSMCDMVSGSYTRVPPRRRAVPSLASTQINMSLQTPEELILFGNEYVKRALKIWMDTRDRIQESDGEHVQQLQLIIQSTKQLIDEIDLYTKQAKKEKDKMRESKVQTLFHN